MNEPAVAHARNGLKNHGEFHLLPDAMKKWISASPSAAVDFHEFFSDGGKFEEVREVGLPFYRSEPRPSIIVDAEAWPRMSAPDALEHPQWHAFGTLAHEIGHHRFNATTVPFTGNTPQQYVQYRSELEGQAIVGAFRIFRELEAVPPFDKQLPFNSIGYLNGIELGQLYKDWKAGRLDDAQAVAAISDKVADTPFRRSDPSPGKDGALTDRNGDGQLTHRDLYLRDFERIPRFHPQPDAPAVEPSAPIQPAVTPLLSDSAHPAHDLYAQTLRAFAASPQIAAAGYSQERQQLLAANLVAGNLNLLESRNGPPLQERIDRVDAATIASDGSHITLIQRAAQNSTSFRFGLPMEQAHSGSLEAASQQAFDGLQQQKAQEIARQAERDLAPQPQPEGPSR